MLSITQRKRKDAISPDSGHTRSGAPLSPGVSKWVITVLHCVLEIAVKELEADGAFFTDSEAIATARCTSSGRVPEWAQGDHPEEWAACPNVRLVDKRGRVLTRLVVLRPGKPLDLEEQDFLEGLGLQSAVAVENARQHKRLLAWERVQQDLAAARAIQSSLRPQTLPTIPGYALDYRCKTCFEVRSSLSHEDS